MRGLVFAVFALLVSRVSTMGCYSYNGCSDNTFGVGAGSGADTFTPTATGDVNYINILVDVSNSDSADHTATVTYTLDLKVGGTTISFLGTLLQSWPAGDTTSVLPLTPVSSSSSVTSGVEYSVTIGQQIFGSGGYVSASMGTSVDGTCDTTFNPSTTWFRVEIYTCASVSSGDPHFYGFLGQKYDVMGQSYEIYNLITSPNLQINSRFNPYFRLPNQIEPTGTMIGELGIKFPSHNIYINSNSSVAILDGSEISLKSDWTLRYGDVVLSNVAVKSNYEITIKNSDLALTFVRKVYRHSGLEAQWHFDYKATLINENPEMHGLLGQTWEAKSFADKQGTAFELLDGYEDDYRIQTNNIFGEEFKFNLFQNL